MKTNIYPLLILFLLSGLFNNLFAQSIPNPSFEDWSNGMPVGWTTQDFITQSTNAYAGQYAVMLSAPETNATFIFATGNSSDGYYYATTGRPASISFWYIFHPTKAGDGLFMQAVGKNSGIGLTSDASTYLYTSDSTSVYKQAIDTFTYNQAGDIDSLSIQFEVNNNNFSYSLASYIIIDDLSFPGITAVENLPENNAPVIENVQPNPAKDRTEVIYTIPTTANVTLELFDVAGKKIKTLVNASQTSGRYKAVIEDNSLPAGNYFCQLNIDGTPASTEKVVVIK